MNNYILAGASLLVGASTIQAKEVAKRPNIIYIMSDDHASQAIGVYGSHLKDVISTPNIDRIANEGVRLDNCFVTNSISTPSRAAIITGQYGHKNGVFTLGDRLDGNLPNMAKEFQKNGYKTAIIGKWHLASEPTGFDYYNVLPGQGRYYDPILIEKRMWKDTKHSEGEGGLGKVYIGHSTDVITDEALSYLKSVDGEEPFFMMCHYKAPHRPWQPAERFKTLYQDVQIPEPENMLDEYVGKGEYTKTLKMGLEVMNRNDLKQPPRKDLSRDEFRHWAYQIYMKDYLRCVAGVDENIGRILKYLDDNNLTNNTIIVYTSDQGFFLGEHGWFDKRLMYEESIRMPFVIRYPEKIKQGRVNKDMVLNIDFAPTLLDFAGISTPEYMQGESFKANLENKKGKLNRKSMYYRYWMNGELAHHTPAHFGIRTDRYKLVFYYSKALGKIGSVETELEPEWELYDLKNDPAEVKNIYSDPKNKKLVQKLKKALLEEKEKYGDTDDQYPAMKEVLEKYFW